MPNLKRLHCPICDAFFSPDSPTTAMPFCSPRCKQIDTARWLGEQYGLPMEEDATTPDSELPPQGDKDIM